MTNEVHMGGEPMKEATTFNAEDVQLYYRWLNHHKNEWTELRAIEWKPDRKGAVTQEWVNNEEDFMSFCRRWNGKRHVYAGLNPRKTKSGTAKDISRVIGIPFDVDPPVDKTAATSEEKTQAQTNACDLMEWFSNHGYSRPYIGDSGNGFHIVQKVDLEVKDSNEISNQLRGYFKEVQHSNPFLEDSIFDLPRILKVPGTLSLKGPNTRERPHRIAKIVSLGDEEPDKKLENHILERPTDSVIEANKSKTVDSRGKLNEKKIQKLRPCFQKMIREGGRFTPKGDRPSESRMRQQFVKEMTSAGFSKKEILAACVKFDDYEKEKTEYEISRVYSEIMREGLTHWKCKSIHKHGGCLGSECRLYAKKIEGTTGTKIGNYRLKRKGNKAFLVTETNEKITSCNLDSVDGPRFKKKLKEITGLEEVEVDQATASFMFALQSIKKRREEDEGPVKPEEEEFDEETQERAWELLRDPAFFYKLGWVFKRGFVVSKLNKPRFIVGEERNKRLLGPLLIGASKLGMTSITKLLGDPATAKDTMLRMWLDLLPIKSIERSYFTAAGLRYSKQMKGADLLYIPDSPHLKGEMGRQMRFMRADDGGLISEYATRDAETGEMVTKVSRLPVKGVATTSNAITGDRALESGMWTLRTNGSEELTREVKEEKLKLHAGKRPLFPEDELRAWRCAFKILMSEELLDELPEVPYAEKLIDLLESTRSESRRDADKFCDLISLIAWTRRFQKKIDWRNEADLLDLYFALQTGLDAITETISELDEKEQRIFQAVEKGESESVTCRYVADKTKVPYKTCYRYLDRLIEKGFLNKDKEGGKNIYSVLSEKTPKTFLISEGRNVEKPEELMEFILDSFKDFSPSHGGPNIVLIDPITGNEVKANTKENGESDITVENKEYFYPYEKVRSSERSEETPSEAEKELKKLLPSKIRKEKAENSVNCFICHKPILPSHMRSVDKGQPAHSSCVNKLKFGKGDV